MPAQMKLGKTINNLSEPAAPRANQMPEESIFGSLSENKKNIEVRNKE
jgi:hypothetical protein